MKRLFEVVFIDSNNCATNEIYTCADITILFAILAKELSNRNMEYGVKKIIIEEVK